MMNRRFFALGLPALAAACGGPEVLIGSDGLPAQRVYNISPGQEAEIQFRMLDGVNALRSAQDAPSLSFSAELNAAAATHARDMAVQNRPWHFGSDGSSPIDRVARVGYEGTLIGETISETYETELETLAAWMENPDTREVILDPRARDMGFAWYQQRAGKIWWTMVLGSPAASLSAA